MKLPKRFDHCDRPVSARTTELMQAADRMARLHRVSWKQALGAIASPVLRLHRYRSAHNRLLQGALRDLDCPDARSCKR